MFILLKRKPESSEEGWWKWDYKMIKQFKENEKASRNNKYNKLK